jgi:cytoskeletal protein RodZ
MTTSRRSPSNRSTRTTTQKVIEPLSITTPLPGSPASQEPSKQETERLGDLLRRMREKRGDDLQYIADYLCIRRNFLELLESSRYSELPADAYVIGFLRSYANYLGIDGKEAIDRYRREMSGRRNKPALSLPTPISEGRTPSAIIMVGAAVAALLLYILWYALSSGDRSAVTVPPALPSSPVVETTSTVTGSQTEAAALPAVPSNLAIIAPPPADAGIMLSSAAPPATTPMPPTATTAISSSAVPAASNDAKPAAPVVPAATTSAEALNKAQVQQLATQTSHASPPAAPPVTDKASRITVRAVQSSWILITNSSGQAIFDRVMKPGEVFSVPNKPGLNLTTGNGSGVILTLDGADMPKLATGVSHVMRNIPLDAEHLRNLPASPDE